MIWVASGRGQSEAASGSVGQRRVGVDPLCRSDQQRRQINAFIGIVSNLNKIILCSVFCVLAELRCSEQLYTSAPCSLSQNSMRKTRRIVSKYHESKTIRLLSQQQQCRLIVSISYDSEIVKSQNVMRDKWYLYIN